MRHTPRHIQCHNLSGSAQSEGYWSGGGQTAFTQAIGRGSRGAAVIAPTSNEDRQVHENTKGAGMRLVIVPVFTFSSVPGHGLVATVTDTRGWGWVMGQRPKNKFV